MLPPEVTVAPPADRASVVRSLVAAFASDPVLLDSPSVVGVERLELDTPHVGVVARTLPGKQFEVGQELRARVAMAFRAEGINVAPALDTAEPIGVA